MLQQTGHAGNWQPLSLLVDHFGFTGGKLPDANGALTASDTQAMWWCIRLGRPTAQCGQRTKRLSALLTRELVLSVENSVLVNVDLLDIPVAPDSHPHPLWRAKLGWMLAIAVMNAARCSGDLQCSWHLIANVLPPVTCYRWVNATQPQHESALPASSGLLLHRMPDLPPSKIWMRPSSG